MVKKVLVVDSDFRTRMQAISAVMGEGYQANIAESTMEAVAAAASDRPDLVLIGDSLTGPSGLALVGRLFSNPATADLPVLVIADSSDAHAAAEQAGARAVLSGPVSGPELLAAIAAHIETPGPIAGAPASVLTDAHRLEAVDALRSSWSEQDGLDRFAALASQMLAAPVSTVSLIDSDRQLFASQLGMSEPWASAGEIPLEYSYCQFAVTSKQPLRINNATVHPLVQGSPAVAELDAVSYLGIPLITGDDQAVGTLCVLDSRPREWTEDDVKVLGDLAAILMDEFGGGRRSPGRHAAP